MLNLERGLRIDRRVQIADAALAVLGADGSRGLTHRAIDRELDLPDGSTSYYFRTRDALLRAAAERLLSLDSADVDAVSTRGGGAALVARWLAPERRVHLIARFELLLTAARDPSFDFMSKARTRFLQHVERGLRQSGVASPRTAAIAYVAAVEGLLFQALVAGPLRPRDADRILQRISTAFVAPDDD